MRSRPCITIIFICFLTTIAVSELAINSCQYNEHELAALRHQTLSMFNHAFHSYIHHAFPLDELQPLSCTGADTFGGLTISLIDTLDTLVILKKWPSFVSSVKYLRNYMTFNLNTTVSVFETTIRVLGGLLSAHGFLTDSAQSTGFDPLFWYPSYDDALLYLAVDLAERLMPVFDTPTSIPYGAVHLQHGVMADESLIASTAGAGSLILELGTLTRYTGDPRYYSAAFEAMSALHERAAWTGLVGNHINIISGDWVATESGVGGLVDSYYEYMLKGYVLFGDVRLLQMFESSYLAIQTHIYKKPWYLDADMWTGQTTNLHQSSLSAFFPELQVLTGRLASAIETTRAHYSAWRKFGCLPEGLNVASWKPVAGQINYPLRPELVEAIWYLHWVTDDPAWIGAAANMLHSLEVNSRTRCGYAEIVNVGTLKKGNIMPSFLMSETLKYLYMVFAAQEDGRAHWTRSGDYVFTTEAHPFRIAVEEFSALLPGIVEKASRSHRRKCPRRQEWEEQLVCGYAMGGTDFPKLDLKSLAPEPLSADVEKQVHLFLQYYGIEAIRIGGVFAGFDSAYRVIRIENNQVFFANIIGREREMWMRKNRTCARVAVRHLLRRKCGPGDMPMIQLV